ncbi:site-2 protease family protein [uncultured Clostridium sp.]|uniref:site-2 protease family protein n=1 Tax=uncultured Clostridium sp. TaxID=59620 RepID=UPI0025F850AC|nr:site-2 protease family protein [uncultured Clostridium sp.]
MNISIYEKLIIIPAIIIAFTFHEYAHAKVADKLGDKTPRFQGRLTLNPAKHIDPIGFILVLIMGFGWAKPVETNPSMFKDYYKDDLKVSLAGPMMNLLLSIVGCFIWVLLIKVQYTSNVAVPQIITDIFRMIFSLNVSLFVFNLLPIPGLDGFWIVRDLKPDLFYKYSGLIDRYGNYIILVVILLGGRLISVPVSGLIRIILNIVTTIVGI